MFEELGFDLVAEYNHELHYLKCINVINQVKKISQTIVFECDFKTFTIENGTPDILQAINKKYQNWGG